VDSAGALFGGLHPSTGSGTRTPAIARDAARREPVRPQGIPAGLGFDDGELPGDGPTAGEPGAALGPYQVIAPLGYEEVKDKRAGNAGRSQLVRVAVGTAQSAGLGAGPGARPTSPQQDAALTAALVAASPAAEPVDTPYFTVPENATLTRVTAMTAIIGRVPVDGRVTDPMQFKAIIGRENLAANGWDVPDDISGIVVSGVAVGDMALSCSEGRIHSLTFVFEDGSIRTVSSRRRGGAAAQGAGTTSAGGQQPALGYISDLWGNPCIAGRFVTNAPAYLTDVVGLRGLAVASRAYAAAQTTTTESAQTDTTSTAVTGSRGAYVLGQAASGATDEVTNWILARLKNSFDAVVTPAGQKVVLHIEQEIAIDKPARPRRLDHQQGGRTATHFGAHHGMD
jgi:integrating conjugative element protein (TIGR03752 family)